MCNRLFDAQTPNHELTDREVRTLESFEPQKILPFVFPKHLYPLAESRDQASSSLCSNGGRRSTPNSSTPTTIFDIKCTWFNDEQYCDFFPRALIAPDPRRSDHAQPAVFFLRRAGRCPQKP